MPKPRTFRSERSISPPAMIGLGGVWLAKLVPVASNVIATQSGWFKASPAREIAEAARALGADVEVVDRVPEAVNRALEIANPDDLILVTGSFYTIGEVKLSY